MCNIELLYEFNLNIYRYIRGIILLLNNIQPFSTLSGNCLSLFYMALFALFSALLALFLRTPKKPSSAHRNHVKRIRTSFKPTQRLVPLHWGEILTKTRPKSASALLALLSPCSCWPYSKQRPDPRAFWPIASSVMLQNEARERLSEREWWRRLGAVDYSQFVTIQLAGCATWPRRAILGLGLGPLPIDLHCVRRAWNALRFGRVFFLLALLLWRTLGA